MRIRCFLHKMLHFTQFNKVSQRIWNITRELVYAQVPDREIISKQIKNYRIVSFLKFPNEAGIDPESWFAAKRLNMKSRTNQIYSVFSKLKLPRESGIGPERLFDDKSLVIKLFQRNKFTNGPAGPDFLMNPGSHQIVGFYSKTCK